MNRMLAKAVGLLNGFLAVCMIIGGTIAGIGGLGGPGGAIVGFIGGGLAAVLLCGLLAVAIDIRDTLHSIDDKLSNRP